MKKHIIHFEIGHECSRNLEEGTTETESVFTSDLLSDCLKEFALKGYKTPEYFMDVWESDDDGTPYPLADLKLNKGTLADYKPKHQTKKQITAGLVTALKDLVQAHTVGMGSSAVNLRVELAQEAIKNAERII